MKSSIGGVLVGAVLCIAAFPVLWVNEGRAVKTAQGLKEGVAVVATVEADKIDPAHEGKLIHVSGPVTTEIPLTDPVFGIKQQALQLIREVEMYQWKEASHSTTKEKIGGGKETTTTYTYKKVWSDKLIKSSAFKEQKGHANPTEMKHGQEKWIAQDAMLGAFTFGAGMAGRLSGAEKLMLTEKDYQYEGALRPTVSDGMLYLGFRPSQPEVGDMRIRWEVLHPTDVSVVARQSGSGFEPYTTKSGSKIELVSKGNLSASAMFSNAVSANKALTWGLRVGGFFLMFIGIVLFFRPLAIIGHLIPIVGKLLDTGLALFAGVLAGVLSLLVIAFSWFAYRPVLASALLLGAMALLLGGRLFFAKTKIQEAQTL